MISTIIEDIKNTSILSINEWMGLLLVHKQKVNRYLNVISEHTFKMKINQKKD